MPIEHNLVCILVLIAGLVLFVCGKEFGNDHALPQ